MRARSEERGFTLIELLIVVAIIGVIAALLIPNFLDALQKAKQKRTVADMRNLGTAWMSHLTDMTSAAAAGATAGRGVVDLNPQYYLPVFDTDLTRRLVPQYIQSIPQKDGWKHDYEFFDAVADKDCCAIRSKGADGVSMGYSFTAGGFEPTDYGQDIVWVSGFFVRWPQKGT